MLTHVKTQSVIPAGSDGAEPLHISPRGLHIAVVTESVSVLSLVSKLCLIRLDYLACYFGIKSDIPMQE